MSKYFNFRKITRVGINARRLILTALALILAVTLFTSCDPNHYVGKGEVTFTLSDTDVKDDTSITISANGNVVATLVNTEEGRSATVVLDEGEYSFTASSESTIYSYTINPGHIAIKRHNSYSVSLEAKRNTYDVTFNSNVADGVIIESLTLTSEDTGDTVNSTKEGDNLKAVLVAGRKYSISKFELQGQESEKFRLAFQAEETTLSITSACEIQLVLTEKGIAKFTVNEQSNDIEAEIKITATSEDGEEVLSTNVTNIQAGYLYLNPDKKYSLKYEILTEFVSFDPGKFGVNLIETTKTNNLSLGSGDTNEEKISLIEYAEVYLDLYEIPVDSITGTIENSNNKSYFKIPWDNNTIKVPTSPNPYTFTFDPVELGSSDIYVILLEGGNTTIDLSKKGRKKIPCSWIWLIGFGDSYQIHSYEGSCTSVVIPDSVNGKVIDDISVSCFSENDYLKEIKLPLRIFNIPQNCFENYSNLEKVIGGDMSIIGQEAFKNCSKMNYIQLFQVQDIGNYAFANCTSLNLSIYSCDKVGDGAFSGWTDKQTIHFFGMENPGEGVPAGWDENWKRNCNAKIFWMGEDPTT